MRLSFLRVALAPFAPAYTLAERFYDPLCQIHDRVFVRVREVERAYDQFELLDAVEDGIWRRASRLDDGPGSQYILGVRVFRSAGRRWG